MGLLGKLRRVIGGSSGGGEGEGAYRCISCGAYLDRDFHSCPECGGQYVAPVEPDDEA